MKVNKPYLLAALGLLGALALTGCSNDANANDNSAKLPPPVNIQGGTKGPQEAAAAAHEQRKGLHYQNAQNEAGGAGGDLGDGK